MPRIYTTRSDAKKVSMTIPMAARLRERLHLYAKAIGLPPTTAAHDLIELGVQEKLVEKRPE